MKNKIANIITALSLIGIFTLSVFLYKGITWGRIVDKLTFVTYGSRATEGCDHDHVLKGDRCPSVLMACALIKEYEGFREDVYICPAGKRTVGYGFTDKLSLMKAPMSREDAEHILVAKVADIQCKILRDFEIFGCSREISDCELAAFSCLVYNIGWVNWKASTIRNNWVYNKSKSEVSGEFSKWVYSKKRVLRGLVRRREAETNLFLSAGK